MKKIATLAVLPVIALASCGKANELPTSDSQKSQTGAAVNESGTTNDVPSSQTGSQESLDSHISSGSVDMSGNGKQAFSFQYDLYGTTVQVKGLFTLKDGKVSAMNFDGTEFEKGKAPLKKFTQEIQNQVIGKQLKGLKVDGVSGASFVSTAFKNYLGTL